MRSAASIIGWPIIAVPYLMKNDLPVEQVRLLCCTLESMGSSPPQRAMPQRRRSEPLYPADVVQSAGEVTRRSSPPPQVAALYRESDSLIQSASASIGDLLMVYKKLQRLAGFTTRVVELLEAVEESKGPPEEEVRALAREAMRQGGAEGGPLMLKE